MNQDKIWTNKEIKEVSQKVWNNIILKTTGR